MRRAVLSCLLLLLMCVFAYNSSQFPVAAQGRPDLVWMRGGSGGPPVYSPNGKYLVSSNGSLQIRRVSDGLLLRDITLPFINGSPNTILTPAVSPDSQYIAAGCVDKSVRLWRISDGQQVLTFQSFASAAVGTVAFSPDGSLLAGGSSDAGIYIWHVSDGSQVHGLHDALGAIKQIAFTPNGQYLVANAIGGAPLYNVSNWQPISPPLVGTAFDISPDSKILAMQLTFDSGATFQIRLYNIPDLSFRGTIGSVTGGNGVRFSPDGRRIAQGSGVGIPAAIGVWNLSDGNAVSTINLSTPLPSPRSGFPSFAFAPDSQTLTTSDVAGAMQEWRVSNGTATRTFTELPYPAEHITTSPDGKLLAEVHNVGIHTLAVRRASDGSLLQSFTYSNYGEEYHNLNSPVFSTDSKFLALDRLYDDGGRVLVYRTSDWSTITLPNSGNARVDYIAFSPDGNYLAAAGANSQGNGTVSVWHLPDFTTRGSFNTPTPTGIAFSPDSHLLAVEWKQNDSRLNPSGTQFYNPENCQYISGFDLHGATIINPIFTSDGQSIIGVYAGSDSVGVWKVSDGSLLQTIDHGQPVNSIALSPDGLVLATCGGTQLKFWLVQGDFLLLTYDQEINNTSLAYSADGKFLYHGRADGSVWQALNPYRNAAFPNHGGNTGNVTVKIVTPVDFPIEADTTVKLTADGLPDIFPISTEVDINSHYVMIATFDLRGVPLGKRNVVITLPDGETRTYPQGFTIEQGVIPQLRLDVIGRNSIRQERPSLYNVISINEGNTDVYDLLLTLTSPTTMQVNMGPPRPRPEQLGLPWPFSLDWNRIPVSTQTASSIDTPIWIYSLSASSSNVVQTSLSLVQPPAQPHTFLDAIHAEVANVPESAYSQTGDPIVVSTSPIIQTIASSMAQATGHNDDQTLQQMQDRAADAAQKLIDFGNHIPSIRGFETAPINEGGGAVLGGVALGLTGAEAGAATGNVLDTLSTALTLLDRGLKSINRHNKAIQDAYTEYVTPNDPNDLAGSLGYGANHWIASQHFLNMTVFFENVSTASAPASDVIITDHLDATKLDMTTVNLQSITFADQIVTPTLDLSLPVGKRQFNADVDLRPKKNLIVRINAILNMLTGELTWHFTSLDPVTGMPPDDPNVGFLDKGQEGSVLFSVMPKQGVPTGTVVSNQASIKFDFNAWMDTPLWFNTLDNDAPMSKVNTLASVQTTTKFFVSWQGTDIGAGVQDFTIYVSDNGGPYMPWLMNTTKVGATFTGVGGHTYAFYSQARDNVFNVEAAHLTPDTSTRIVAIATDVSGKVKVTRGGFRLNRTTGRFVQMVTLTNTGSTTITGPVSLVLDGLSSNAALFNPTGTTSATTPTGSPYLNVQAGDLAAGASVAVTLEFTNTDSKKGITYTTRVLAGSGTR